VQRAKKSHTVVHTDANVRRGLKARAVNIVSCCYHMYTRTVSSDFTVMRVIGLLMIISFSEPLEAKSDSQKVSYDYSK